MKVLEILKRIAYEEVEKFAIYNTEQKDMDEAIAELEALENRSCEGCIYVGKSNCINCLSCKRQYSDNWRNK